MEERFRPVRPLINDGNRVYPPYSLSGDSVNTEGKLPYNSSLKEKVYEVYQEMFE